MIDARQCAGSQSQGARPYQEDAFTLLSPVAPTDASPGGSLMVLADGMGGHKGGREASTTAVEAFAQAFQRSGGTPRERLEAALRQANDQIACISRGRPDLAGCGCTLVGVLLTAEGVFWVSVGDSPLWLCRDGHLIRLNEDHSMMPVLREQVRRGRLTEAEARVHPHRHVLRAAVIGEELPLVDLPAAPCRLRPGDLVLAASDGILTLDEAEIAGIVSQDAGRTAAELSDALVAAVERLRRPGQDNVTVLVARSGGGGAAAAAPPSSRRAWLALAVLVPLAFLAGAGGMFAFDRLRGPDPWLPPGWFRALFPSKTGSPSGQPPAPTPVPAESPKASDPLSQGAAAPDGGAAGLSPPAMQPDTQPGPAPSAVGQDHSDQAAMPDKGTSPSHSTPPHQAATPDKAKPSSHSTSPQTGSPPAPVAVASPPAETGAAASPAVPPPAPEPASPSPAVPAEAGGS